MVGGIIVLGIFAAYFVWAYTTESGRKQMAEANARRANKKAAKNATISTVGQRTEAGLACPKCGGTQFKVRRRTSTKVAFGAASLLGQAKHVRCVTCGTEYRRG